MAMIIILWNLLLDILGFGDATTPLTLLRVRNVRVRLIEVRGQNHQFTHPQNGDTYSAFSHHVLIMTLLKTTFSYLPTELETKIDH
jgi:hypothetical protein